MNTSYFTNTAVVLALLASLSACTKPGETVGPAQKAGAAIDKTGDQIAAELHKPIDKANEVKESVNAAALETRAQIEQATSDASRGIDKATVEVGKKVEQAGEKIQEAGK
jgi:F0F1-type ATP synthase membrane subunit b/b'